MTDYAFNLEMRGNITGGMDRILSMPRASVYINGGGTAPSATTFAATWDSIEYQTEGMWKAAAPTRLTCITQGVYAVEAWVEWAANGTGVRQMWLNKNNSTVTSPRTFSPLAANVCDLGTTAHIQMYAGDYLEVMCRQESGGVLAFNGGTLTNRVNGFQACLIST